MTPWGKAYDAKMREHLQLLRWWRRTPLKDLKAALGNVHHSQVEKRLDGKTLIKAWEAPALAQAMGVDPKEFLDGLLGDLHVEVYLARIAKGNNRQKLYAGSDLMNQCPSRSYTAEELRSMADGLQDLRIVDPESARRQALDILQSAQRYGIDAGVESRFQAALALGAVYRARGGYGAAATFLLIALDLAGTDECMRARLHHAIIHLAGDMGDVEVGLQAAEAAIAVFQHLEDPLGRGRVLVSKGSLLGQSGHLDEAIDAFCEGLQLISEDRWYWRIACFQGLGFALMLKGDLASALKYSDRFVGALESKTVPPRQVAAARWLRGEILLRMGDSAGIAELRAVLELCSKEKSLQLDLALISLRLAYAYFDQEKLAELRRFTAKLTPLLEKVAANNKLLEGAVTEFNSMAIRGELSRGALKRIYSALLEANEKAPNTAQLVLE